MFVRKIRTKFYFAVEGEGEQSFVKLLQNFADQSHLWVHLECQVLGGGGYKTMFKQALEYRKRNNKQKNKAKASILLVDGDRDQRNEDGWTIGRLKQESIKEKFQLCVQQPNQEGLFLRMMPGNERIQPSPMNIDKQLIKFWPNYQKPVDAQALSLKFKLSDLVRVAMVDYG